MGKNDEWIDENMVLKIPLDINDLETFSFMGVFKSKMFAMRYANIS